MQEKRRFEESWRDAFDGAEMTPPEHVWVNVELDLAGDESRKMKKRVIFYQRLAAALLIVSASLGVYVWNDWETPAPLAETKQTTPENKTTPADETPSNNLSNKSADAEMTAAVRTPGGRTATGAAKAFNNRGSQTEALVSEPAATYANQGSLLTDTVNDLAKVIDHAIDELTNTSQVALQSTKADEKPADSVKEMSTEEALQILQAYANPEEEKPQQKKQRTETLWLAMGGAAGSYNPRSSAAGDALSSPGALMDKTSFANSQVGVPSETSQHTVGSAYSVGMAVGTKVGERWILQSGLNYIHQQIDYTSNVRAVTTTNQSRLVTPEYLGDALPESLASVTTTSPYTINSAMEFISIPVQAGYLIIDRRVAWQVNTGVSSDIFVRNTLVDESGRVEKFSQAAGSDSPFRAVNWSGLLNTEVSYRLTKNYRVAVVPGMRYSITSILKDAVSTPLILDLGFRFRYVFAE